MKNILNNSEVPMGLGMALAKNRNAMQVFSNLAEDKQREIIAHTHSIQSKQEMQAYVDSICHANSEQS